MSYVKLNKTPLKKSFKPKPTRLNVHVYDEDKSFLIKIIQ